ncbi:MAG: hypothetical protein SGJ19_06425 [Planctomycetia bacterium]|nr:hypothetical protein [Planctomycetia bacterium]
MKSKWPFGDSENTAVFTSKKILDGADWVYYVTHDADDGAWQFHPHSGPTPEAEAAVASFKSMLGIDDSIRALANLPLGWHAWRKSKSSPWTRSKMETS